MYTVPQKADLKPSHVYFTSIRMAIVEKKQKVTSVAKDRGKLEPCVCWLGCKVVQPLGRSVAV